MRLGSKEFLSVLTGGRVGIWVPPIGGLGEIDGLLVPPGKASKLLTDHLNTGKPLKSEPTQEKWFSQTVHTYKSYWFAWVVIFMKHIFSVMTS